MFVKDEAEISAEWEVSSEELCIWASWIFSPINKNSVLEELRVTRLAVIYALYVYIRTKHTSTPT